MSGTNAAALNGRPSMSDDDDRWPSTYDQVLTRAVHEVRSVEDDAGYWLSLVATLIAAVAIGLAVLTMTAIA
jgi:hypothetical protein